MPGNHTQPHTPEARAKMSRAHAGVPRPWRRRPTRDVNGECHYRCGTCREFKPRSGYYKDRRAPTGLKNQCKECHTATVRATRDPIKTRANKRRSEAKRRANKAACGVAASPADIRALEAAWGAECVKCGSGARLHWDHIVPLARGGEHSINNLQRLCKGCNERKHTRTADYRSRAQKVWVLEFEVQA